MLALALQCTGNLAGLLVDYFRVRKSLVCFRNGSATKWPIIGVRRPGPERILDLQVRVEVTNLCRGTL